MSPTIEATMVETILVAISLLAAYVLLRVLEGTAIIRRKGLQLGGSAAVFVVVLVLLNKYLPELQKGILTETAAAQPITITNGKEQKNTVSVSVSPAAQILTKRDLDSLDRNSFYVDNDLGIGVKQEDRRIWETNRFEKIDTISLADLPVLQSSSGMLQAMMLNDIQSPIFGVRRKVGTEIVINKSSSVQGVPVTTNLYEDKGFVTKIMRSQVDLMVRLGLTTSEQAEKILDEKVLELISQELTSKFSQYIDHALPIKRSVHDGVYVTILEKDALSGGIIEKLRPNMSLVDRALLKVSLTGANSGGYENLYVDQNQGIASFNSGIDLKHVMIDEQESDIHINHVAFLVAGRQRVMFVDLIYLSVDGIGVFQQLQDILNSLRLSG